MRIIKTVFRKLASFFRTAFFSGKGKVRLMFLLVLLVLVLVGFFDFPMYWDKGADKLNDKMHSQERVQFIKNITIPHFWNIPFRLGLDLQGGTHLVYKADLSQIGSASATDAMQGVRDVIERRVNAFGVTEPLVQINKAGNDYRLLVDLAGVQDVKEAIKMIGETPTLDFREETPQQEYENMIQTQKAQGMTDEQVKSLDIYFRYKQSELTGKYLKSASVDFDQNTGKAQVAIEFNDEGGKLFENITERNTGKPLAIYLDGAPISIPRVNEKITGGRAVITGNFSVVEAKDLARRLNAGALPVPISLISQQTIGPSLGQESLDKSVKAGIFGLLFVAVYMVILYRLLGLFSAFSLFFYSVLVLFLFKGVPVTLTLSGIAGFIMSIGIAADANILIFERFREELKSGKPFSVSVTEAFARAWPSVRDSNISTLLTCLVLFWFGTSVIKGFALTLSVGIVVSLFSAMFITRLFLKMVGESSATKYHWLWVRK